MKNDRLKHKITYLFLVLFISMKMTGLHILSHANDEDHDVECIFCDHAITHNLTPLLINNLQDFLIENTEFIVQRKIVKSYSFVISNTIASNQLFSRPPPLLL